MASNFNDTTPAAPTGGVNVKWQTDGAGNDSAYLPAFSVGGGASVQTGSYTATNADSGKLIQFNAASAAVYTLLNPIPNTSWWVIVKSINVGVITVSRNSLTIDGKSSNVTLTQGDSVAIFTDGTNYRTGLPRPQTLTAFIPGVGTNAQVCLYLKLDRPTIFPASAPNSFAVAKAAATGSTTYSLSQNGSSFATTVFSASGTTGAWTQASDAVFAAGDILEIDGPATADATLANIGITLQGYRF